MRKAIALFLVLAACQSHDENTTTVFVREDTPINCKPKKDREPKRDKAPDVVFIIEVENELPELVTCEDL